MMRKVIAAGAVLAVLAMAWVAWASVGGNGSAHETGDFERNFPDGVRAYFLRVNAPAGNDVSVIVKPFGIYPDTTIVRAGEDLPRYLSDGFTGFEIINGSATVTDVYWNR